MIPKISTSKRKQERPQPAGSPENASLSMTINGYFIQWNTSDKNELRWTRVIAKTFKEPPKRYRAGSMTQSNQLKIPSKVSNTSPYIIKQINAVTIIMPPQMMQSNPLISSAGA